VPDQALRRVLLEINGLSDKNRPHWFDTIKLLHSRKAVSWSNNEIVAGLGLSARPANFDPTASLKISADAIQIEGDRFRYMGRKRYRNKYSFRPDFYVKYYSPIAQWLLPENYKVFEKWKQKYHFGREID